jgi:hypothetical protein
MGWPMMGTPAQDWEDYCASIEDYEPDPVPCADCGYEFPDTELRDYHTIENGKPKTYRLCQDCFDLHITTPDDNT